MSDHNDHYFEAEEGFEVEVSGRIGITLDPEKVGSISADSLGEYIELEIDSIDEIDIVNWASQSEPDPFE